MIIALDVMGGDHAPGCNIVGLAAALRDLPAVARFMLVGDRDTIVQELARHHLPAEHPRYEIVHASQVVTMGESSTTAIRGKRDSSITVAANLLKTGRAQALVSAGHTGATVAATVFLCKMLPGIDRPAIAAVFPSPHGPFVMLDVGANVECKPTHLAQYAILGEAYSHFVLKVAKPRVGILSVGEEDSKGNELTREAFRLLKQLPINFQGNVEGNKLFSDKVDVIVCDGFVGNAVLKSCESMAKAMGSMLKDRLYRSPWRRLGAMLSRNAFRELKEMTDHEEYGGAPLLGINGICIKAHGSASGKAIRNALRVASEMVDQRVNDHILEKLNKVDWAGLGAPPAGAPAPSGAATPAPQSASPGA